VLVFAHLLNNFQLMLTDRSYMRSDYPRQYTSAVVWLIAALVAAFALELILLSPWFGSTGASLVNQLPLTIRSLQSGHVWTLLTHSFLHSTTSPFPILFTILGLIFIGRELEPLLGAKRFLSVYAGALLLGALCWTAVHWSQGGVHLGASAGVLGLFVVLACLYPNQEISFLILFLFPVRLRPKYLVYGLIVLNVFALIVYEIPGTPAPFEYAPSVHLGGMLAGWIYFRYSHANNGWDRAPTLELPAWLRRSEKTNADTRPAKEKPVRPSANLRAEVDLILDKINSQGFGALTEEEKRILDEAKDLLSRP
jgi:membrane associated rhomboid family serine protease